jgi:hypothetical protein
LLTVLSIVFIAFFSRRVGWESFMRQQMDQQMQSNERLAQLTPEQREQAMALQVMIAKYAGMAMAVVGMTLMVLLISAVMLGSLNLLGGAGLKYKQVFSITAYSYLPTAISSILALVVLLLKNPEDFDLNNPLPANLGAFLNPQTTPKWLVALAGSFDLFSFWVMLLMALGFSVAARRMSYSKSLMLVMTPWAVYVLLKVALTAAFT